MSQDRPTAPVLPRAGDITVTPSINGYMIGAMTPDAHNWVMLDEDRQWGRALRKAFRYAILRDTRVIGSRSGDVLQVFDPVAMWFDSDRQWWSLDVEFVRYYSPRQPGIYVLRSIVPVFIGDTDNLHDRLLHHLENPSVCEVAAMPLSFSFETMPRADVRLRSATELISGWDTPCNQFAPSSVVSLTDG